MNKLVDILNLSIPADLNATYDLASHIPEHLRPVVLIGPYEHHSNELPWRESIAEVIEIDEDADGHIDQRVLTAALERVKDRPLKIGSFSAASNVTGIATDVRAITPRRCGPARPSTVIISSVMPSANRSWSGPMLSKGSTASISRDDDTSASASASSTERAVA